MQDYLPLRFFCALSIFVMSAISVYSKPPLNKVVYARELTVENGLSSNFVYALLKDSKNFTWIGTINGLNKYDGQTFRHYFHQPFDSIGIQSNIIKALAEDKAGAIWIGTTGGGLEKLDRKYDKFTHFRFNPSDQTSIGSDNVECLFVDSKGRLWIGLENGELDYFEPQTQKFWRYKNVADINFALPVNPIVSITEDSNGLWLGKTRGTVIFNPATGESEPLIVMDSRIHQFIQPGLLNTDSKHRYNFYVASDHSVYYYKSVLPKLYLTEGVQIKPAMPIGSRTIFAFINDTIIWNFSAFGLKEINNSSLTFSDINILSLTQSPIKVSAAFSIITNGDGSFWIATENGIVIIDPMLQPILTYNLPNENILSYSTVRSLCLDKSGKLWIGTNTGNLYYLDTLKAELKNYLHLESYNAINRMSADKDNYLWLVTTGKPLLHLNTQNHVFKEWKMNDMFPVSRSTHSLLIENSSLWFGAEERGELGVEKSLNYVSFSPFSLRQYEYLPFDSTLTLRRIITTIVKRDDYSLWIGSVHGLFIFNKQTCEFTRFSHNPHDTKSLSGDYVWVIHPDSRGQIWVGTWNDGLNLFDEKIKMFRHYTIEDGLPSNSIRSILEDKNGDLWISTENGISHYDQNKKIFTNFGISDGLLDLVYEPNSAAISTDGKLYFGGSRGIISFYPENLQRKNFEAPLFVTSFRVEDHLRFGELPNGSQIDLNYTENDLSFEFAKLDYLNPLQKQYEYMLEGFDKIWIRSGAIPIAQYNNIEPGDYIFKFRLKDDTAHSFACFITIDSPFWGKLWFKLSILLVIILTVGFVYRQRIRKLKIHQAQLSLATENERIALAGDLHDGPLQDLYGSRFLLDPFMKVEQYKINATSLDEVLKKVRSDLRTMTGELQIPRFESGFAEELRLFCEGFGERNKAINVFQNISNETHALPTKLAQNLFRIFRTAMANVSKHANASIVEVTFVTTAEAATLKVIDNGIGFTVPETFSTLIQSKHYGLFMMRDYAKSVSGKCMIFSAPGKGTTVEITIPLKPPLWRKKALRQLTNLFTVFLQR
jgi:ligand-binding sensor domain-containing protein/signal transduction histidine kinase